MMKIWCGQTLFKSIPPYRRFRCNIEMYFLAHISIKSVQCLDMNKFEERLRNVFRITYFSQSTIASSTQYFSVYHTMYTLLLWVGEKSAICYPWFVNYFSVWQNRSSQFPVQVWCSLISVSFQIIWNKQQAQITQLHVKTHTFKTHKPW